MRETALKTGGGCDFRLYPAHSAWVAPYLRALICCFCCVFVRFFAPFCGAGGLAARRWLGGELDGFWDAYFYCALLVVNCTQVRVRRSPSGVRLRGRRFAEELYGGVSLGSRRPVAYRATEYADFSKGSQCSAGNSAEAPIGCELWQKQDRIM